jgi:hypothetical protein
MLRCNVQEIESNLAQKSCNYNYLRRYLYTCNEGSDVNDDTKWGHPERTSESRDLDEISPLRASRSGRDDGSVDVR